MSTARQEALALIARHGADFDDHVVGGLVGGAYTPAGTVWSATGCHTLAINFLTDRPAGWRALLADLRLGVQPCPDPRCEMCETPRSTP